VRFFGARFDPQDNHSRPPAALYERRNGRKGKRKTGVRKLPFAVAPNLDFPTGSLSEPDGRTGGKRDSGEGSYPTRAPTCIRTIGKSEKQQIWRGG